MILSAQARYAVMAMVDLAAQSPGKPVTLAAIAKRQEIPAAYLVQIFAKLKRAGIIRSTAGPGGGYNLVSAPGRISIATIVEASGEKLKMTRCANTSDAPGCMAKKARCRTHDLWNQLGLQIEAYLAGVSLEDVCADRVTRPHGPEWLRDVNLDRDSIAEKKKNTEEHQRRKNPEPRIRRL